MKGLLIGAALLVLSGCATTQDKVRYNHVDGNEGRAEQLAREYADCTSQVQAAFAGRAQIFFIPQMNEQHKHCMRARGWIKES